MSPEQFERPLALQRRCTGPEIRAVRSRLRISGHRDIERLICGAPDWHLRYPPGAACRTFRDAFGDTSRPERAESRRIAHPVAWQDLQPFPSTHAEGWLCYACQKTTRFPTGSSMSVWLGMSMPSVRG